jgi:hypothetical protein
MRYLIAILVALSVACGGSDTKNGSPDAGGGDVLDDATPEGCDYDVLDVSCCSDRDYVVRHMDICLQEESITQREETQAEAERRNEQMTSPEPGDALDDCAASADELIHLCEDGATASNSCYWSGSHKYKNYSGSIFQVECNCFDAEGFEQIRESKC